MNRRFILPYFALIVALSAMSACSGGGSSSNQTQPTTPPTATPTVGPLTASPNPLVLGVSATDSNHIVALTLTQPNATGLIASIAGCTGTIVQSQPFNNNESIANGTLTATLSSYIGAVVGTCSLTITPASGAALVIPVTVNP